ncbi:AI-2E family transporter [Nocardioides terrisoli]|uniref:AI-2E family transporter n=1 Tax=Nocardioides terrisoli TaxID=3388267 RepID=UPI00287B6656|nr:AI-2E family transporter [Nocardioides marmorisolisilvae]
MVRESRPALSGGWRARRRQRSARARSEAEQRLASSRAREEKLRERLAQQWAEARSTRHQAEPRIEGGASNFTRAEVPYGVDLAAAWSWRFIVITVALVMILWGLRHAALVVLPLILALFLAALLAPLVRWLERVHVPRKLGSLIVVLISVSAVALLLAFVGQQVSAGIGHLSDQVVDGLEKIRDWLRTGPLNASDSQINDFIQNAQDVVSREGKHLAGKVTEIGTAVGHIVAGFFIVLFATYFFLADGKVIWAWIVRLFPRAARLRADASGQVAHRSLTQFVRATVLVAATDAIGIVIWALVLGLPFLGAIGVLVFLGAFVPMIGATLSGTVAVLVALVAKGPITALLMLAGVVVVQQVEAHVLQPFLMGRFVSVHPLGVIVAIATGVIIAGIPGALIAVPFVAAVNAVVQYLAEETDIGEQPDEAAEGDPGPDPALADDRLDAVTVDSAGEESLEDDPERDPGERAVERPGSGSDGSEE